MGIEFLHRGEIDTGRWNDVIMHSPAETLYPYSWYLDAAAENWSALVMGDYRFIMPLVWKKKYGIRYLYQPSFCQQLGVFSKEYVDPLLIGEFVAFFLKRFRFGVLNFNVRNTLGDGPAIDVYDRSNYVLPLQKSYEDLVASYSTNARRNLKKAEDHGLEFDKEVSIEDLIRLRREEGIKSRSEAEYARMEAQFLAVKEHSSASVFGVRKEGRLLSAAFFACSKSRVIYLLSVSSEEGKELRAMFKIINEAVRTWSGSDYTLDFEGSSIPSIARFFGGFGARAEIYQSLSFNRFPLSFILGRRNGK